MNTKDRVSKQFFRRNDRFADLINGVLYKGEQVIDSTFLEETENELNEKIKKKNTESRRRDLIKRYRCDGEREFFYAVEFQSTIDETMPLRMMEYDALTYLKMMELEKEIYPVAGICLYTGEREWKAPVSLYEMMNLHDELDDYVQDYRTRVVHALNQDITRFHHPEVKELFELIHDVYFLNRHELLRKYENRKLYSPDAVECASILTDCDELNQLVVLDEGGHRMCQNFKNIIAELKDEARTEGLAEGRAEGREQGIAEGRAEGRIEGQKEGVQQEKIHVIQRLSQMNVSVELISAAVALSTAEVQRLLA